MEALQLVAFGLSCVSLGISLSCLIRAIVSWRHFNDFDNK